MELTTHGAATTVGKTTIYTSRTSEDTTRHIWAIVYRCKDDARGDE
jgi:hypothetical protein